MIQKHRYIVYSLVCIMSQFTRIHHSLELREQIVHASSNRKTLQLKTAGIGCIDLSSVYYRWKLILDVEKSIKLVDKVLIINFKFSMKNMFYSMR